MSKKIIALLIGVAGVAGGGAGLLTADDLTARGVVPPAKSRIHYQSATTTETGEAFSQVLFEPDHPKKGSCLVLKNADGNGYSYLTVQNGKLNINAVGCAE